MYFNFQFKLVCWFCSAELYMYKGIPQDFAATNSSLEYSDNLQICAEVTATLLLTAGQDQPVMAALAMSAIFTDKKRVHQVNLENINAKGKREWVQVEMWPTTDYYLNEPAMLVSTLNVTHQRELELQLGAAKDQLQRCA